MRRRTAIWPSTAVRWVVRPDGSQKQGPVRSVEKPQAGQVGPRGARSAGGGFVPAVQVHGRVQAGIAGAARC